MRTLFSHAVLALALAGLAPLASAADTVLTFDDIAEAGAMPANYGGLDWSAAGWLAFNGADAPFAAHSGSGQAATDWGVSDDATVIRFQQAAVFDGAWFSGYSDVSVSFTLFFDGHQVGHSTLLQASDVSTFLASGYAGLVDAVTVGSNGQGGGFAMDDFTFTSAVPEPQTLALMLAGLAGVAYAARRRA